MRWSSQQRYAVFAAMVAVGAFAAAALVGGCTTHELGSADAGHADPYCSGATGSDYVTSSTSGFPAGRRLCGDAGTSFDEDAGTDAGVPCISPSEVCAEYCLGGECRVSQGNTGISVICHGPNGSSC